MKGKSHPGEHDMQPPLPASRYQLPLGRGSPRRGKGSYFGTCQSCAKWKVKFPRWGKRGAGE